MYWPSAQSLGAREDSLEWQGSLPPWPTDGGCPGMQGLLSGSEKGVSVQAGGLGQEGESSTMVLLVTENRELV